LRSWGRLDLLGLSRLSGRSVQSHLLDLSRLLGLLDPLGLLGRSHLLGLLGRSRLLGLLGRSHLLGLLDLLDLLDLLGRSRLLDLSRLWGRLARSDLLGLSGPRAPPFHRKIKGRRHGSAASWKMIRQQTRLRSHNPNCSRSRHPSSRSTTSFPIPHLRQSVQALHTIQ
jgi:hypothetical protein